MSARAKFLIAAAFLFVWELLGRALELRPDFIPTPSRIVLEIYRSAPELKSHAVRTCLDLASGYLLAAAAGIPVGILLASWERGYHLASRAVTLLEETPLVILTPLFFVWLGFGSLPKILVVFLLCLFPMTAGIMSGLRSVPREMADLLRTANAGWLQSFRAVRFPMSLPKLFQGMRTATAAAMVGIAAAEFFAAEGGLGYVMLEGVARMNTPLVFAALGIFAAAGFLLHTAVVLLESALVPASSHSRRQNRQPALNTSKP